jgi:excisionase family DNA binding protein
MKKTNPGHYPVIFKIIDGYLVVHSPEFGMVVKKKFDLLRQAEEIGNLYLDLVRKMDEEIKALSKRKMKIPEARKLKDVLPKESQTFYSVTEMARMLGVSSDTVRRMADEGALKCRLTRGGHRKFTHAEMQRATEDLDTSSPATHEV